MTERRIATPERVCGICGVRTHLFDPDSRTWIPDAPHARKCPTRPDTDKAAA